MKDIVDLHTSRKFELVSEITDFLFDLKGAKIAVHEFLDAVEFEAQMFAAVEDSITSLKFSMASLFIGVGLHVVLR